MLLHVLSAKRELSWNAFRRAFDVLTMRETLDIPNASFARSLLLRRFESLAHAELVHSDHARRVVVSPSTLARLPSEEPTGILCGCRSVETLDQVTAVAADCGVSVSVGAHPGDDAALLPSVITLRAPQSSALETCAKTLRIEYQGTPAAWNLGQLSAGIEQVRARLQFENASELNWTLSDFDVSRCHFRRRSGGRPRSCLTRYANPKTGAFRYCLWNGNVSAWVDPDWGRFLALGDARAEVLLFDPSAHVLALPETVPLPRLLARALTLCSGYIAAANAGLYYGGHTRANLFSDVPKTLAELVAAKLGQTLSYRRLNL
jgi:hypothetical protein